MPLLNWDSARFFLAVARAGTLRGAARRMQVDQATVGRRLAALEAELQARLFLRTPGAYVLTPAGEALLEPAEAAERAFADMEHRVLGLDARLTGTVRVASTDSLGRRFVIPAIARMRREHPGIGAVLLASQDVANLTRREADVAIRTLRPDSPDLIVRRLATLTTGIYASRAYLATRGPPRSVSALAGHDVLQYLQAPAPTRPSSLCGVPIAGAQVVFRTSSTVTMVEAALAGIGVAELPCYRADTEPELLRILPERVADFDVWLVAHGDLFRTARLQALVSALVAEFDAFAAGAVPAGVVAASPTEPV